MANFFKGIFIIFIALIIIGGISGTSENSNQSYKSKFLINQVVTFESNVGYACLDKETIYQASKYYKQGDQSAGGRLLLANATIGKCTILRKGEQFYVMDNQGGLLKVRRQGEAIEYYTPEGSFR